MTTTTKAKKWPKKPLSFWLETKDNTLFRPIVQANGQADTEYMLVGPWTANEADAETQARNYCRAYPNVPTPTEVPQDMIVCNTDAWPEKDLNINGVLDAIRAAGKGYDVHVARKGHTFHIYNRHNAIMFETYLAAGKSNIPIAIRG